MAIERSPHAAGGAAPAGNGHAESEEMRLRSALEQLAVAEEELRQQNDELIQSRYAAEVDRQRYETLFQSAPEAYLVTDIYGKIGEVNGTATALFRLPPERVIGRPIFNFVPMAARRRIRVAIATALRTSEVLHEVFPVLVANSSPRDVEASVTLRLIVGERALTWMLRDVTEQAEYARRLATLNTELDERVRARTADLERASAVKDEFLGLISHELRTPITTIYGNAEILRRKGAKMDADTRGAAVEDIYVETSRLQRLVDDLLLLARSQSTAAELEPVMPQRIVERIAAEFERERGRAVEVNVGQHIPAVSAEPTYLEQVLRNLLSNAEKYSPPGRPIKIAVARFGRRVRFTVADRGDGVATKDEASIFKAFFRSPTRHGDAPGLGVGLAVCRRLVMAQDGRIWVRPREGGGAEFVFTLAVAPEWD